MNESSKGWSGILPYLFVVLAGFAAFFPTLRVGFLWDDHVMIENNRHIQSVNGANLRHAFGHDVFEGSGDAYYRPLQTLSNMVDYQVWGARPFGFHLTNLLFHLLNACLLFFLFKKIASPAVSLLAAIFFVVHPVIVEQLLIIAGRAEIMSMTFILLTIIFAGMGGPWSQFGSLICYLAACLFKESGVVAPCFLFLLGFLNSRYRRPWTNYLFYGSVCVLYFILRKPVSTTIIGDWTGFGRFLIQELPTLVVGYIHLILFPTDLHSHRRILFHPSWIFMSPIFLLLIGAWFWIRKSPLAWFGLAWFLLGLLPKIPLLATNGLMLDHWGYLGSPGIYLILTELIFGRHSRESGNPGFKPDFENPVQELDAHFRGHDEFPEGMGLLTNQVAIGFAGMLLLFWISMDWWNWINRNTDEKMYRWALKYPSSSIVRYNLGLICYERGDLSEAEQLFKESLRMNPRSAFTLNGLALTTWQQGRRSEALTILSTAISMKGDFAPSYYNRALIERGSAGLKDLDRALILNPDYEKAKELKTRLEKGEGRN